MYFIIKDQIKQTLQSQPLNIEHLINNKQTFLFISLYFFFIYKLLIEFKDKSRKKVQRYNSLYKFFFNLYVNLTLVIERRDGTLPAWEGIRLARFKL